MTGRKFRNWSLRGFDTDLTKIFTKEGDSKIQGFGNWIGIHLNFGNGMGIGKILNGQEEIRLLKGRIFNFVATSWKSSQTQKTPKNAGQLPVALDNGSVP